MSSINSEVIVGLLALAASMATVCITFIIAWMATKQKRQITEINDAVNHRHAHGGLRLYDMVIENHQNYADLATDVKEMVAWKRRVDEHMERIDVRLDALPCLMGRNPCKPRVQKDDSNEADLSG